MTAAGVAVFVVVVMVCALFPAVLFAINFGLYRTPRQPAAGAALPSISVLIPARNEERVIGAAIASVMASVGVEFELVVMDDGSTDNTAAMVRAWAAKDARVRLEHAPLLPAGWNGKQHACWALAHAARHEVFCFVDADVTLHPEALLRMAGFLEQSDAALVSGFPQQETETTLEWLLLPLIHFVLLGFLPLAGMRTRTAPAYAAGCGQFLMVERAAYFTSGGHAEIRETMHDGLRLPKLLRQHGMRTDLADLTQLAECRMYRSAGEVWQGLAKNATEGLAAPGRIVPITVLLLLGQVMPVLLLLWLMVTGYALAFPVLVCALVAVWASFVPRFLAAWRYRQRLRSAWLHPVGVLTLLVLQWYSLLRQMRGGAVNWKARSYVGE